MTVMRETGLIVVSAERGSLFQLSLQEGRLIGKEIRHPCKHRLYLLYVQVAGREYLALSCMDCRDIKLMDLNKQEEDNSKLPLMQYHIITAFSGLRVDRMCHGEENRIFVNVSDDNLLELDASTTTLTGTFVVYSAGSLTPRQTSLEMFLSCERRSFNLEGLCYVPEPHRLIVVSRGQL